MATILCLQGTLALVVNHDSLPRFTGRLIERRLEHARVRLAGAHIFRRDQKIDQVIQSATPEFILLFGGEVVGDDPNLRSAVEDL